MVGTHPIVWLLCWNCIGLHWQNGRYFPDKNFKWIYLKMKVYAFRLRFNWSLFQKVQLTIFQHWFREWLGADQATSHYRNQWWWVYWRMYASFGLNELMDICRELWPYGVTDFRQHCAWVMVCVMAALPQPMLSYRWLVSQGHICQNFRYASWS